jgi:hypothetical protein
MLNLPLDEVPRGVPRAGPDPAQLEREAVARMTGLPIEEVL